MLSSSFLVLHPLHVFLLEFHQSFETIAFLPHPRLIHGVKLPALFLLLTHVLIHAKLVTRTVDYADAHGTPLEGYVVYDDAKAARARA